MIKIDVGCYVRKKTGYVGVDIERSENVDVQGDARRLPFMTDSIEALYTRHTLEHIPDILAVLYEFYRVCKDQAEIEMIMPHFTSYEYFNDLTHIRPFAARTFDYYDRMKMAVSRNPDYLPEIDLEVTRVEFHWWDPDQLRRKRGVKKLLLGTVNSIINGIANWHPFLCERIWGRWVGGFCEIRYLMRVHKPPRTRSRVLITDR